MVFKLFKHFIDYIFFARHVSGDKYGHERLMMNVWIVRTIYFYAYLLLNMYREILFWNLIIFDGLLVFVIPSIFIEYIIVMLHSIDVFSNKTRVGMFYVSTV